MVVQDTKFAWADDEVPVRRDESLRERSGADLRNEPTVPVADSLRELEPPRAFTQVSQGAPSAPAASTTLPTSPVPPTPAFPEPSVPNSLYVPDPIVESPVVDAPFAGHSGPSLDTIFDVRPATAPAEALDALFGERETRRAGTRVKTPIVTVDHVAATATASGSKISNTAPAWIIAMIPLFQVVISLLILNLVGQAGSQFIYIAILAVPYFIVLLLAYFDHKALLESGHERPAHWGWAVLTAPVYLLVRARSVIRETGHGIGPVLVWGGLALLQVASLVAVPGVLIATVPSAFTAQIEESVASDAMLIAGSQMSVDCVGNPPVLPRETMTCTSVDASNHSFDITVTLVRSNGWIAWQVVDWGSFGN